MKATSLFTLTLAGFLALTAQSMAQTAIPAVVLEQPVYTTGMVGFTTNQTARLTVLNLNSAAATTTPSSTTTTTTPNNCTVQLQFFDGQDKSLKSALVTNFAPQTATSLDLTRTEVTTQTTPRAEIRGVVTVNPIATPVASPAVPGYCSVFTTLEVFDATSGSTITFTSDTRVSNAGPVMLPLSALR